MDKILATAFVIVLTTCYPICAETLTGTATEKIGKQERFLIVGIRETVFIAFQ